MSRSVRVRSESAAPRPRLTALAEKILSFVKVKAGEVSSRPLEHIPRRLLIVKVHGMGDSVLIRMILEQIRRNNPTIEIGLLASPATEEILTLGADFRVHLYKQKELTTRFAFRVLVGIRRAHYEAVLNFEQSSIAGTAFIGCTGIPVHVGYLNQACGPRSLFVTHGVGFEQSRSMWDTFITLARIVDPDITDETQVLPLELFGDSATWIDRWWRTNVGDESVDAIALHLGSGPGMDFKRWPIASFVELAGRIADSGASQKVMILTGTSHERTLISEFLSKYEGKAVDASGVGSVMRTAAVLRRCRLLVSNDTGIMHLGAALGVATVGLFGPTSHKQWAPVGQHATYLSDTALPCSPCVDTYRNLMPTRCCNPDSGRCMRDIRVSSILTAVRDVSPHLLG